MDSEPPAGLDWDMWLGPAPKVPFNANRFGVGANRWSTFRHFWDYSNGMLGDWAVHLVDIVQWALETPGPQVITAAGQKRAVKDNADTPDTLQTTFEYPEFVCTYENRQANGNSMFGKGYGIEFHGTEATMFLNRSGFEVFPETRKEKDDDGKDKEVARAASMRMDEVDDGLYNHAGNMLECLKSRKRPASDIEDGLHSSATCLLGVGRAPHEGAHRVRPGQARAPERQPGCAEALRPRVPLALEADRVARPIDSPAGRPYLRAVLRDGPDMHDHALDQLVALSNRLGDPARDYVILGKGTPRRGPMPRPSGSRPAARSSGPPARRSSCACASPLSSRCSRRARSTMRRSSRGSSGRRWMPRRQPIPPWRRFSTPCAFSWRESPSWPTPIPPP